MTTEVGDLLVGAYLKTILKCDFVAYNVRPPGGGLKGLGELDVIGLKFSDKVAFLCEVTTHIEGMLYGDGSKDTITKLRRKRDVQGIYALENLSEFSHHFMFWSPVVGPKVTALLQDIDIELIINKDYTAKVNELRAAAKRQANDEGNPVFRLLQILERLK